MNLVIFVTDQERSLQHFPPGWGRRNLSLSSQLVNNGITFNQACCCASMCSPSRASLFTGLFPAQHGVTATLEPNIPDFPVQQLPFNVTNLAHVMEAAGYEVVFKGKWHLSLPPTPREAPFSGALQPYRFGRWNPPDAGENTSLSQFGGGFAANDRRFVFGFNEDIEWQEGARSYIRRAARNGRQPFCLIVSLVNPHDVLSYPNSYLDGGYTPEWLEGEIGLPATVFEDLSTKPTAQRGQKIALDGGLGILKDDQQRLNYLNFYGNLMRYVDRQLLAVYRTLGEEGLLEDTLVVRTSDHGEMGLAHDGLRQKNFNVYEETLRVPMIISNPKLFRGSFRSNALVSHVDFVPTMASLFNSPERSPVWEGRDYSHLITGRGEGPPPQDYQLFTFDDVRTGQNVPATAPPPNHIICIREERYKFALYYDPSNNVPEEYEMYDLLLDPLETRNIGNPDVPITAFEESEFHRLRGKLNEVADNRLQPLERSLEPPERVF